MKIIKVVARAIVLILAFYGLVMLYQIFGKPALPESPEPTPREKRHSEIRASLEKTRPIKVKGDDQRVD